MERIITPEIVYNIPNLAKEEKLVKELMVLREAGVEVIEFTGNIKKLELIVPYLQVTQNSVSYLVNFQKSLEMLSEKVLNTLEAVKINKQISCSKKLKDIDLYCMYTTGVVTDKVVLYD